MVATQVDSRLLWLRGASCRGHDLQTVTISEPIASFYIAFAVNRSVFGWRRVIEGLIRFVHSFQVLTFDAGRVGEIATQLLAVLAVDQVRFANFGGALTPQRAESITAVSFHDVLEKLIRRRNFADILIWCIELPESSNS